MTISTDDALVSGRVVPAHERRAGRELALEWIFRPPAGAVVPWLARSRVPPPAVVIANAVVGLCAAFVLSRGELVVAAALLQLKTVLDNADGQLARELDRVTLAGRYLDTEVDLVVNAALCAALAHVTGQPWLALGAFLALTLVLAVDFNVSELYREEAYRNAVQPPLAVGGRVEGFLRRIYRVVFLPQDWLVRRFSASRLERVLAGRPASETVRLSYHDGLSVTVLANLGLSTQLAILGLCLVVGAPAAYLWFVLGTLPLLLALQLRRESLARRALQQ